MLKKLDKLILKAFIGPFVATFFISLFVLVMQFFWKYIDDLVGKGLDMYSMLKLTSYLTVTLIPLALPLAILLSSIMTFGNLGESFELVAIKSAGIPLLRFMRPLLMVSIVLCLIAFLISNYVLPVAQMKFITMLYDIRVAKPAFDIKEGIFYDKIPGYAIKIGKKDKGGTRIEDIVIYENQFILQDNFITAEKGEMRMSDDKKFLEFNLENGWRYQEKGTFATTKTDFYRIGFKTYRKSFDLSSFEVLKTPDSAFKGNYLMLNVSQLNKAADSIKSIIDKDVLVRLDKEVTGQLKNHELFRKSWKQGSLPKFPDSVSTYAETVPQNLRTIVYMKAADKIYNIKSSLDILAAEFTQKEKERRYSRLEWHKRFALSFACFVLFIIGAPLGSIIRKGGLGMPLVIAVVFFLIFHLLNMFGEKFVRQDLAQPVVGMWMSTMVLIPVGVFLVYKAMNDSQLFNNEFYFRTFRSIRRKIPLLRTRTT